jgi:DNA repair protein SbcD/Mre11
MARILHVADLHQGLLTHSWPDPATGIPSRLLDVAKCWHDAVAIAIARKVQLVIVAGDIFHTRNPDAMSLNLFAEGLRFLEHVGIPTVIVAGNHDGATHPKHTSVLHVFESDLVRVQSAPGVVDLDGFRIACLPWVSRAQLLADNPGISREGAVHAQTEALERILDKLRADGAHVLTGHWSIQGAVLGSEADIAIVGEGEPVLPQSSLEGPWGYAAFGHIHGSQTGDAGDTLWTYSGSIDRMNFGEEHEDKIAWDVNLLAGGRVGSIIKAELPARRFLTIDALDDPDPYSAEQIEGAIVRVRNVPGDRMAFAQQDLLRMGAARVYVEREVIHATRARVEKVTASLGLEESIAEYFDATNVNETDRPLLRDMAKSLSEEAG